MPAYYFIDDILRPYVRETGPDKRMSTQKVEAVCVGHLEEFFRGKLISFGDARNTINGSEVRAYREWRKASGVSPLTVKRELAVASKAVNYAIAEWDYHIPNPFEKRLISDKDARAVRHKTRKRIVSKQEEIRLLTASDPLLQDIIVFAVNTGLRLGEICNLTWEQLRENEIWFQPHENKAGRFQKRGLNSKARTVAERQPTVCEYVFTVNGGKVKERYVQDRFAAARDKAGLPDVRFKDLRKTCGQRLKDIAGIEAAKTQLGHANVRTTEEAYVEDNVGVIMDALEAI